MILEIVEHDNFFLRSVGQNEDHVSNLSGTK